MKFNFDGDDIHYIAEDWFEILVANQDENKHLDAETLAYISRVMLDCPSFKKLMPVIIKELVGYYKHYES
jgi:hypothetical protein